MRTFVVVMLALALLPIGTSGCRSEREAAPSEPQAAGESDLPEWSIGRRAMRVQLGVVPLEYAARVRAESNEAAKALFEPVRREGTRIPLPPGVDVDMFTSVELSSGRICLHDSVSGELDVFRMTVGDETVADLLSGKNVDVTRPGGRWITYTACLTPTRVTAGSMVVLTTHPRGKPPEATCTSSLQF
jgi:hypothetical protein